MRRIDPGIDHRDRNPVAGREAMRLGEIELLGRILIGVRGRRRIFRQPVEIIRLSARDLRFARERADHRPHLFDVADAPAVQRASGEANAVAVDGHHREIGGNAVARLGRHGGRDIDQHLVGEAQLAGRRLVEPVAQRTQRAPARSGRSRTQRSWRRGRLEDRAERRRGRRVVSTRVNEQFIRDHPADDGHHCAANNVPDDIAVGVGARIIRPTRAGIVSASARRTADVGKALRMRCIRHDGCDHDDGQQHPDERRPDHFPIVLPTRRLKHLSGRNGVTFRQRCGENNLTWHRPGDAGAASRQQRKNDYLVGSPTTCAANHQTRLR